jgi:hypothetical protein
MELQQQLVLWRAAGQQGTAGGRGCGSTQRRRGQAVAAKHGRAAHGTGDERAVAAAQEDGEEQSAG